MSDRGAKAAIPATSTGIKLRVISPQDFAQALPAPPPSAPKARATEEAAEEDAEEE